MAPLVLRARALTLLPLKGLGPGTSLNGPPRLSFAPTVRGYSNSLTSPNAMASYLWGLADTGIKYLTAEEAKAIDADLMGEDGAFSLDQVGSPLFKAAWAEVGSCRRAGLLREGREVGVAGKTAWVPVELVKRRQSHGSVRTASASGTTGGGHQPHWAASAHRVPFSLRARALTPRYAAHGTCRALGRPSPLHHLPPRPRTPPRRERRQAEADERARARVLWTGEPGWRWARRGEAPV